MDQSRAAEARWRNVSPKKLREIVVEVLPDRGNGAENAPDDTMAVSQCRAIPSAQVPGEVPCRPAMISAG
ncbi:hypothetical protein MPLA_1830165 [Mesorhizobium sp. ORS 3359]|nr:hypothetical protein MPLA_1830165 [Mesorhizobium sp. ORS 3359]